MANQQKDGYINTHQWLNTYNNMTKQEIYKMVGAKNDAHFDKMFPPTEEGERAFIAKYGKKIKKAQGGVTSLPEFSRNAVFDQMDNTLNAKYKFSTPVASNMGEMMGAPDITQRLQPHMLPQMKSPDLAKKPGVSGITSMKGTGVMDYLSSATDIVEGIGKLKEQHKALDISKQNTQLSGLALTATQTKDIDKNRQRYDEAIKKREAIMQPIPNNALYNDYGQGTNVLAKSGKKIKKAGAGFMSFLNDSKFGQFMGTPMSEGSNLNIGDDLTSKISGMVVNGGKGEDAGSMIGGGIGGAIGTYFGGPVGKAVGTFAGKIVGGAIDRTDNKIAKNKKQQESDIIKITGQNSIAPFAAFAEAGKTITNSSDDGSIQTLRNGNLEKLTPYGIYGIRGDEHSDPSGGVRMDINGQPIMAEAGEKVKKGKDGDVTIFSKTTKIHPLIAKAMGMDEIANMSYSKAMDIAVIEKQKKAKKLEEKSKKLLEYNGNDLLKLNTAKINIIAANQELAVAKDAEEKLTDLQEATIAAADELGVDASELSKGKLKPVKQSDLFTTSMAKQGKLIPKAQGGNTSWPADKEEEFHKWALRNKSNDTPEVRQRFEKKWQSDKQVENYNRTKGLYNSYLGAYNKMSYDDFVRNIYGFGIESKMDPKFREWYTDYKKKYIPEKKATTTPTTTLAPAAAKDTKQNNNTDGSRNKDGNKNTPPLDISKYKFTPEHFRKEIPIANPEDALGKEELSKFDYTDTTPWHQPLPKGTIMPPSRKILEETWDSNSNDNSDGETPMNPWVQALNSILPYIRPSNMEELDPRQLAGEMYALQNNQVEPVQAQTYQPQLAQPYDISLQDILNENRGSTRAAQKLAGYNPAAAAMIAAQEYEANQKVLGEQFRLNQNMKGTIYDQNRNTLNQAQLTNLGIFDKQYERQEMAKSKTKADTIAALNSIASKYLQNQTENRTLATYENMYNYRFDPKFRAMNMNPLAQFDMNGANSGESNDGIRHMGDKDLLPIYGSDGNPTGYKVKQESKTKKIKFGGAISPNNQSIVRQAKSL